MFDFHWNSENILPPVDCPIVILVGNQPPLSLHATRISHLSSKDHQMEYRIRETGEIMIGRFPWTYP